MLNIAELATAVEAQAPIILLVFNDRGYGVLRMLQERQGVPRIGVDLHTPDFVAIGLAMGLSATRVATAQAFERALADAARVPGSIADRDRPRRYSASDTMNAAAWRNRHR